MNLLRIGSSATALSSAEKLGADADEERKGACLEAIESVRRGANGTAAATVADADVADPPPSESADSLSKLSRSAAVIAAGSRLEGGVGELALASAPLQNSLSCGVVRPLAADASARLTASASSERSLIEVADEDLGSSRVDENEWPSEGEAGRERKCCCARSNDERHSFVERDIVDEGERSWIRSSEKSICRIQYNGVIIFFISNIGTI